MELEPKFLLDVSMMRMAKQLRLLGYDAKCDSAIPHTMLVFVAQSERRVFITASRTLLPQLEKLARPSAPRQRLIVGYNSDGESEYESEEDCSDLRYVYVSTNQPFGQQMVSLMEQVKLTWRPERIFSLCVGCNERLRSVAKETVEARVNPTVFRIYNKFYQCPHCEKVFWGMDNGVVVNYKAMRTVEHLKRFCCGMTGPATHVPRQFISFPRVVKVCVIGFLLPAEIDVLELAFPSMRDLFNAVRQGTVSKFVPDHKKAKNLRCSGAL